MRRVAVGLGRRLPGVGLNLAAAFGAACLAVSVLAPVLGLRPLIFESGSMSPTIPVGSLGVARLTSPEDLRIGDVVTVPFGEKYVTHRIVNLGHVGGMLVVTLQGDGNRHPDPTPYRVPSAVPRVVAFAPAAGTVLAWFTRTPGVYVLAAYLVLWMWRLQRYQQRKQAATALSGIPGQEPRQEREDDISDYVGIRGPAALLQSTSES
jgi:signal peptidase I